MDGSLPNIFRADRRDLTRRPFGAIFWTAGLHRCARVCAGAGIRDLPGKTVV